MKYQPVADMGRVKFVPLIFETFGGWAPKAEKCVNSLCAFWALRHWTSQFAAAQKIRARVSAAVIKGTTSLLLRTHGGFAPEGVALSSF